jgi:DNA-binding protein HU-beta
MATKPAKKRMTQAEVVTHFAVKTGLKRNEVRQFFDELVNLAAVEVKAKREFVVPNIGKLVLAERRARAGRNPATGEAIYIPAKTALKFRVGMAMKTGVLPGLPTKRKKPSVPKKKITA